MLNKIKLCCHGELSLHIRQNTKSWKKYYPKGFRPFGFEWLIIFSTMRLSTCLTAKCSFRPTSDKHCKLCIRNIYFSYKFLAKCLPKMCQSPLPSLKLILLNHNRLKITFNFFNHHLCLVERLVLFFTHIYIPPAYPKLFFADVLMC